MANNPTLDATMLQAAQAAYAIQDNGSFTGTLPEGYVEDTRLDKRVNLNTGFKVWTSPVSMDTGLSNFHDRLELSR